LPVATASAKRVFAAMKFVKNQLCNKMSNWWLNDCLVTFTKRDALRKINNSGRARKIIELGQNFTYINI
jgi:hypothetical protein